MNQLPDETVTRFIQLRAQNWSFDRIAAELNVTKKTLIEWSRKCAVEIQNFRALDLDQRISQSKFTPSDCVEQLDADFRRVRAELDRRELTEMTPAQLFNLAARLRLEAERINRPPKLAETITTDHPHEDRFPDPVANWKA